VFIHLAGSREVLAARMEGRSDHFMPAALLDSQLSTLEPLSTNERGATIDVSSTVERVVTEATEAVRAWSAL
jgi:carbohydrate kinase (thermoresistant glucokinase family)